MSIILFTTAALLLLAWKFSYFILLFDGPLNSLSKKLGFQSQDENHEFFGKEAIVTSQFLSNGTQTPGKVEFQGSSWTADLVDCQATSLSEGDIVEITGVKNLTLLVRPKKFIV